MLNFNKVICIVIIVISEYVDMNPIEKRYLSVVK